VVASPRLNASRCHSNTLICEFVIRFRSGDLEPEMFRPGDERVSLLSGNSS